MLVFNNVTTLGQRASEAHEMYTFKELEKVDSESSLRMTELKIIFDIGIIRCILD